MSTSDERTSRSRGGLCAGGPTPWGTWLSCEEHASGQVWECDPQQASQGVVRPGLGTRLAESLETALELSDGLVFAEDADTGERTTFSAKFACPVSGFTIAEIEPRLF